MSHWKNYKKTQYFTLLSMRHRWHIDVTTKYRCHIDETWISLQSITMFYLTIEALSMTQIKRCNYQTSMWLRCNNNVTTKYHNCTFNRGINIEQDIIYNYTRTYVRQCNFQGLFNDKKWLHCGHTDHIYSTLLACSPHANRTHVCLISKVWS